MIHKIYNHGSQNNKEPVLIYLAMILKNLRTHFYYLYIYEKESLIWKTNLQISKTKLKTFRHIGTLILVSFGSIFRQVVSNCCHLMLNPSWDARQSSMTQYQRVEKKYHCFWSCSQKKNLHNLCSITPRNMNPTSRRKSS